MVDAVCAQCCAKLTDGYCEYCGWNSPKTVQSKSLNLSGLLCDLYVTKETCKFEPKVGSPAVIENKEIAHIHFIQAPVVGTGELALITATGFTQKVTFLSPQNPNLGEITSYLRQAAPQAQFSNQPPQNPNLGDIASRLRQAAPPAQFSDTAAAPFDGASCPKCKSNNTKMTGISRKISVWKIAVGLLLVFMGIGVTAGEAGAALFFVVGGLALAANGIGLFGKKKSDCVCMNCRNRFRV
ncbi:MAG: hypothetical protein FWE69_06795 [Clostridiales bacterium]|nr:hypothetical protein [Clostridiales bacterium]